MWKFLTNQSNKNEKTTTSTPMQQKNVTQQSEKEYFFEKLKEIIQSIELDLKNTNLNTHHNLLKICRSLIYSDKYNQFSMDFSRQYNLNKVKECIVYGTLDSDNKSQLDRLDMKYMEYKPKDHIWIVVGLCEGSCFDNDFIYKQYQEKEPKWIIDIQPILDDMNNYITILDYNEHPEYVPYGNKTIANVEEYFKSTQSKLNPNNLIIYQKPIYYTTMDNDFIKINDGYYFDANILLFLLDSDFLSNPVRYVNNTNKELFEKIQKNVHELKMVINSKDVLSIKSYIVYLFRENEKIELIPKYYQIMFFNK